MKTYNFEQIKTKIREFVETNTPPKRLVILNNPQNNEIRCFLQSLVNVRDVNSVAMVTIADKFDKKGANIESIAELKEHFPKLGSNFDYDSSKYSTLSVVVYLSPEGKLAISPFHVIDHLASMFGKNYIAVVDWSEDAQFPDFEGLEVIAFDEEKK